VDEERAGDSGLFPGCGKAETVAGVGAATGPADGDAISLGDEIADVDVDASVNGLASSLFAASDMLPPGALAGLA
jgi:hypothetical protein